MIIFEVGLLLLFQFLSWRDLIAYQCLFCGENDKIIGSVFQTHLVGEEKKIINFFIEIMDQTH